MKKEIKDVRIEGECVVVIFEDGHQAEFTPYSHGLGFQIEGLRRFRLLRGEEVVCDYSARLHYAGPQDDENQIVYIKEGYTPKNVAEYWGLAKKCTDKMYWSAKGEKRQEKLWYQWIVCSQGWIDLGILEKGKSCLVEKTTTA